MGLNRRVLTSENSSRWMAYPIETTGGTREILTRSVNGVIARRSLKQKRERSHRDIARP